MSQPVCFNIRDQEACRRAAAILTQSRRESPPDEPAMKRYVHPMPCPGACPPFPPPAVDGAMDRVLEELTRQNQLLVELLGAVNALTAATLGIRSRFVGEN